MGMTMQELAERMTAQEFGQHYAMELQEGLPPAQRAAQAHLIAAVANGALVQPEAGRNWRAADFAPDPWAPDDTPPPAAEEQQQTVEQILASATLAGMET